MKILSKARLGVFLIFSLLVACSQAEDNGTPSPIVLTGASSEISSLTITPTVTLFPTEILTPATLLTETLVPPLPQPEAEERVIELLQDNGSCRLPCFWGIVPGQTTRQTIISQISAFHNLDRSSNPHAGSLINIPGNDSNIGLSLSVKYSDDPFEPIQWLWVYIDTYQMIENEDGIRKNYVYDDLSFAKYTQYYSLAQILSNYGPPERAKMLLDLKEKYFEEDHLILFLDYVDAGWNVQYRMLLEKNEKQHYVGCPAQALIALHLWLPGDAIAAEASVAWLEDYYTFPIEEATSLSLDEFYEKFQDPSQCLQTPIDIWPQSAQQEEQ